MFKVDKKGVGDLQKGPIACAFVAVKKGIGVKVSGLMIGKPIDPYTIAFGEAGALVVPKDTTELHVLRVRARTIKDVVELNRDELKKALAAIEAAPVPQEPKKKGKE